MNRRDFLTTTAAFSTVSLLHGSQPTGAAAAESTATGLRLGTVTYNLARTWDIETIIKNCAEAQFEGVELRSTHAHGVEPELGAEKRKEVRRRFEDSPVELVQLGSACEYHSPDAEEVRRNVELTKAFIKLAADVGAPAVKVRPNGLPAGVPEEKTLEQIGLAFRECAEFGADHGVQIRMEVHGQETSRLPRMRRILDYADHPNAWLVWNSNHTDLLDGGLEENFQRVESRIGLVHLHDLFDEEYPWRRLFELLKGIGYSGFCLAEIPESTDPLRVMKYFRALFRAYQGL